MWHLAVHVAHRNNVRYLQSEHYMTAMGAQMVRNLTWPQLLKHAGEIPLPQPIKDQPIVMGTMVNSAPKEPEKSNEDADMVSTKSHKKQKSTTTAPTHTQTQLDWKVEPTTKYDMQWMLSSCRKPHWCWGDGHCFYYAIAMLQGSLPLNVVQRIYHMTRDRPPTCCAALEWLSNTNNWQSKEELEEQQLVLQCCQCMDCNALLQHNKVAMDLRSSTRQQLLHHGAWMVHCNGNTNEAHKEMKSALQNVQNMNRFQNASWATVLEIRAMALALQRDVYVMENTHRIRLPCVRYPAEPWSTNDPRAQHFQLYEICSPDAIASIANNANNICIYYNSVNHFEPLMAT